MKSKQEMTRDKGNAKRGKGLTNEKKKKSVTDLNHSG